MLALLKVQGIQDQTRQALAEPMEFVGRTDILQIITFLLNYTCNELYKRSCIETGINQFTLASTDVNTILLQTNFKFHNIT